MKQKEKHIAVANEARGGQQPASTYATVHMDSKHSEQCNKALKKGFGKHDQSSASDTTTEYLW